jgi:hypothetical protein
MGRPKVALPPLPVLLTKPRLTAQQGPDLTTPSFPRSIQRVFDKLSPVGQPYIIGSVSARPKAGFSRASAPSRVVRTALRRGKDRVVVLEAMSTRPISRQDSDPPEFHGKACAELVSPRDVGNAGCFPVTPAHTQRDSIICPDPVCMTTDSQTQPSQQGETALQISGSLLPGSVFVGRSTRSSCAQSPPTMTMPNALYLTVFSDSPLSEDSIAFTSLSDPECGLGEYDTAYSAGWRTGSSSTVQSVSVINSNASLFDCFIPSQLGTIRSRELSFDGVDDPVSVANKRRRLSEQN